MTAEFGLLIDYQYCSGCHSCEMACKVRQDMNDDQFGIKVNQIGPFYIEEDKYMYRYLPAPTDMCDLCPELTAKDKRPSCVQHCQSLCMMYGKLSDLQQELVKKPLQVLYAIK